MKNYLGFVVAILLLVSCTKVKDSDLYIIKEPEDRGYSLDWRELNPQISSVLFIDERQGYSVGWNGVILSTSDGGKTWKHQESGVDANLFSLFFINKKVGWIIGEEVLLSTVDGGKRWKKQQSGVDVVSLFFNNEKIGWAVGNHIGKENKGVIISTIDGGKTWQKHWSQVDVTLRSIFFVNENVGWVVGDSSLILFTIDGGKTWKKQNKNLDRDLDEIYFINEKTGWILDNGSSYFSEDGAILFTDDGGKTWQQKLSNMIPNPHSICFVNEKAGWIAGKERGNFSKNVILSTVDGGSTWNKQMSVVDSICFVNEKLGWGTSNGAVHFTVDGGTIWQEQLNTDIFGFNLDSIFFINEKTGWISGSNGSIFSTVDGGQTWERQLKEEDLFLDSIYFVNEKVGWAAGGGENQEGVILSTIDGGSTWDRQKNMEGVPLISIYFIDDKNGWAVGFNFRNQNKRIMLSTSNGGKTWEKQLSGTNENLISIYFIDKKIGWAVGTKGVILSTVDSGKTWHKQSSEVDVNLKSVFFKNEKLGWIAGNGGIILKTLNGGKTWLRRQVGNGKFSSIYFANEDFGWAIDSSGFLYFSDDGGDSWRKEKVHKYESDLSSISIIDKKAGYILGRHGRLIKGSVSNLVPFVSGVKQTSRGLDTILHFDVSDDKNAYDVKCKKIEIRRIGEETWNSYVNDKTIEKISSNSFVAKWQPSLKSILPGKSYQYRITLEDGEGLNYSHVIIKKFTYKSLWDNKWFRGILITLIIFAIYLLFCFILLMVKPSLLLWIHHKIPLADSTASLPVSSPLELVLKIILSLTFVPFFVKHSRVCDDWVMARIHLVRDGINRIPTYNERKLYIPLPLEIENDVVGTPDVQLFRTYFKRKDSPFILSIQGRGGSGKSTIACQIMSWALSEMGDERLAPYVQIPVLIEEECDDLFLLLKNEIIRLTGTESLEDWFIKNLLRKRRILVVIDALSERSTDMQEYISTIHRKMPYLYALIITSRQSIDFAPMQSLTVKPGKIDDQTFLYFLTEYIQKRNYKDRFAGRQGVQLADRLYSILELGSSHLEITPLLIKLFVDNAIETVKEKGDISDLPLSIPQTLIAYLESLNSGKKKNSLHLENKQILKAARILGSLSLKENYQPKGFFEDEALTLLQESNLEAKPGDILEWFILSGILSRYERGGINIIRFETDPISEYLAALHEAYKQKENKDGWNILFDKIKKVEGYPHTMSGFIIALEDCVKTYKKDFRIPDIEIFFDILNKL